MNGRHWGDEWASRGGGVEVGGGGVRAYGEVNGRTLEEAKERARAERAKHWGDEWAALGRRMGKVRGGGVEAYRVVNG